MSLRVSNIRLGLDQPEAILPEKLADILGVPSDLLGPWRILRKSLDARDKDRIGFVYSVEVTLADKEAKVAQLAGDRAMPEARVELYSEPAFVMPEPGSQPLPQRTIVVGSGPGGLVAGTKRVFGGPGGQGATLRSLLVGFAHEQICRHGQAAHADDGTGG